MSEVLDLRCAALCHSLKDKELTYRTLGHGQE